MSSTERPLLKCSVLGAQGVWCNALFFAYLLSPRTVHRFVGYLEEEAVITYTRQIQDLDAGRLPKWEKLQAPQIAIDYWNMPEGSRSMRDLLLYSTYLLYLLKHFLMHICSPRRREQAS
jgi:ubiquinol oxidase